MRSACHEREIVDVVVVFISINMMDTFAGTEAPSDHFLNEDAMDLPTTMRVVFASVFKVALGS